MSPSPFRFKPPKLTDAEISTGRLVWRRYACSRAKQLVHSDPTIDDREVVKTPGGWLVLPSTLHCFDAVRRRRAPCRFFYAEEHIFCGLLRIVVANPSIVDHAHRTSCLQERAEDILVQEPCPDSSLNPLSISIHQPGSTQVRFTSRPPGGSVLRHEPPRHRWTSRSTQWSSFAARKADRARVANPYFSS